MAVRRARIRADPVDIDSKYDTTRSVVRQQPVVFEEARAGEQPRGHATGRICHHRLV